MWEKLPHKEKEEYKRMILAFASLSEMFSQKAEEDGVIPCPIINSKYQETVFQKSFHANAEDIGNTSYDASINKGINKKYLIGIKTFGINSGLQKIAQFKANHDEWLDIIEKIRHNAYREDGSLRSQEEINRINRELYLELAKRISELRNKRIESSEANLSGFKPKAEEEIEAVYHVLMPSPRGETEPTISVGEISYSKIDIGNIRIIGCTSPRNSTNFDFTDGNHKYRFTSADSQLLMDFQNQEIIREKWNVKYADAYSVFSRLADDIYESEWSYAAEPQEVFYHTKNEQQGESYSWMITNTDGEVELFSGFNSFYGTGSKLGIAARKNRIENIRTEYEGKISNTILETVLKNLYSFLLTSSGSECGRVDKVMLRNKTMEICQSTGNTSFIEDTSKLLYRPFNEMYIPIPNSRAFHNQHPDFFGKGIGTFRDNTSALALSKEQRKFNLVFDPSGDSLTAYITQDNGKAIESANKQSYLGEWILRRVFQLDPYEPLTSKRLNEIGINAIRLIKDHKTNDIHLSFIWIDKENPPEDFINRNT